MPPPQTPLRRVSYHSLYRRSLSASRNSALGASVSDPSAPSCLAFLGPAFAEFTDEVETLAEHAQRTAELDQTLREFNEGFAAYLYALEMNAFTTWWPQAPTEDSFILAQIRAEEDTRLAEEAARRVARPSSPPPPKHTPTPSTDDFADQTYADVDPSFGTGNVTVKSAGSAPGTARKGSKPKLTAKERRERSALVEKVIGQLPLMFRGNDPTLRRNAESVVERFLDNEGRGLKLLDFVAPSELNEARARKCLLALASAKVARSDNSSGTVLYHWLGLSTGR